MSKFNIKLLDSTCYTYLAAYRDLIDYIIIHGSEENLVRLLCLSRMPTDKIAKRLTIADAKNGTVAELLMDEFCN